MCPAKHLGPTITPQQFGRVQAFFDVAKLDEAKLITGGAAATITGQDGGLDIAPAVYADVTNYMRVAREEAFGPVGVLIPFDTDHNASRIANGSDHGLIGAL
ncbi:hypothetical protein CUR21_05345 [Pseudorhodobacter sp. MZDSW-24AT]|nr:hypothetical protein CUR21_05345 [Pseudorhodobacter sp. MZDSW-24AT]